MTIPQSSVGNLLLGSLSPHDYALIAPDLVRIPLSIRLQLHEAHRRIERVYFPEDGVVSIVAVTLDGKHCEVGLFGREGMSETATVLGTDHSPHEAYVQIVGTSAISLSVEALGQAFDRSPTLRRHLLRYVQAMMIQLSCSIAAASLTIPQRLARWLLMCHDRMGTDEFHLTHEFIGMMLNVRRAGMTLAMRRLAADGLIGVRRATVIIRDRPGLRRLAQDSYGLAESEYARLIGQPLERGDGGAVRRPVPAAHGS